MPAAHVLALALVNSLVLAAVTDVHAQPDKQDRLSGDSVLALQVALDRMRFSPGPIDGKLGANTRKALKAFQRAHGLPEVGRPDDTVRESIGKDPEQPPLTDYRIAENDVDGPFATEIPEKLEEQAELERLSYTSPAELLAEKFHMHIDLLKRLNPGKRFDEAGRTIKVTNVDRAEAPKAARIEVNKAIGGVLAFDSEDKLIAFYPATIGSEETPSPSGKLEITRIARNPTYTYDPAKLSFKDVTTTEKLEIEPGPNNPVGLVWIALNKPGYGIHGSPEPAAVSRQSSHGCVRLTNWDALDLAKMVRKGLLVEFKEGDAAARGAAQRK